MSQSFRFCPRCATPLELAAVDGGPQRLRCPDPACGFVHWDNPVPVVAAIVEHEGEVILARNRLWPPKMFALITGFLEKDDPDPASGVLREVDEELGLQGRVAEFVGHYPFERMNQIIIAYHVVAEGEVRLGDELAEYKKLPPEKLRPWPAATGLALRDWMLRRGLTPLAFENDALKAIHAFREIDPRLATAGQPTAGQLRAVRASGYQTVINLLPSDSKWALPDEAALAQELGLVYHQIPVAWEAPTAQDFARFCELMEAEAGRRVFVHCAANKRVSAFVFLYRVLRQGVPREVAERDLLAVWQPDELWRAFIDARLAQPA
ncbi:MAG: NUDIX domain-containing protein [Nevskia sp.]|nr:NUDIX domain-containing protein [Nevskia sp.]